MHGGRDFGDRLAVEIAPPQCFLLVGSQPGKSSGNGPIPALGPANWLGEVWRARKASASYRRFSVDRPLAGVKLVPGGIANIAFVNQPQPGSKLGVAVPLELGDVFVDRQARLLHKVGRIDPPRSPIVELPIGQSPEKAAVSL